MQIEKNRVVSLTYTLTLQNGDVVDTATEETPFVFIHGIGQTLPHFDKGLDNLKAGDSFEFDITVSDRCFCALRVSTYHQKLTSSYIIGYDAF